MNRKIALCVVACAMAACLAVLCGCGGDGPQAARFGSHTISENEVSAFTESYRAENGLENDADWANYVLANYVDVKTWREEAVRTLADHVLIEEKAADLGIEVNEENVQQALADAKKNAGVDPSDEQAWSAYLSEKGLTADEYLERLRYSSLEEQVYRSELDFSEKLQDEMCSDYIKMHYADQVMHRYWGIGFDADAQGKAKAEKVLGQLEGLKGEALRKRFRELYEQQTGQSADGEGYILGWDFLYAESGVDPQVMLRNSNLKAGELYDEVLEGTDAYRVVMCDEVVDFVNTDYTALKSESMRGIIRQMTLASTWAAKCKEYLSGLEKAAGIQVSPMPSGLTYDTVTEN